MKTFRQISALITAMAALLSFGGAFAMPQSTPEVLPLQGYVIGIDPGHQLHADNDTEPVYPGSETAFKERMSRGTAGVRTGVMEHEINLIVSKKLAHLLSDAGASVVLTRTKSNVSLSNIDRAQMMNQAEVDFWVRIHCNNSHSQDTSGALVISPHSTLEIADSSAELAQCVLQSFCEETGANNKGVCYSSYQTGFNWSVSPVITVEMGYLSNPVEDVRLCRDYYQTLCAQGIYKGILAYCAGGASQ